MDTSGEAMGADRQEIIEALGGAPATAANARVMLRELFCGETRLKPLPKGGLRADRKLQPAALLRAAGTCGSGRALGAVTATRAQALRIR